MLPRLHRHPWMDEDIESFREQVRRVIAAELAPQVESWRHQGFIPRENWRRLAAIGALLPELEERYGGSGANLAYQLVVLDELARVEIPVTTGVHSVVAHYILTYGTEEQKDRWLPRMASGELLAGLALTEPAAGSDLKELSTRAHREGDEYILDGSKTFISAAYSGNMLVVAARTGGKGSRGVSLIVLETENLPGFVVSRRLEKIGLHASDTCEIHFDAVRVPVSHRLGSVEGEGFVQLMSQLHYERMLLAVQAAAVIERAVEVTVEYTRQRRAFGQTLSDLQNTRFKLAECATTAHIARTFVNDCIQRLLDGTLDAEAAYMAKWWCTEQQCRVTDECLQLFGGYGYMTEYPIARMYADARVQKIVGGTNEIMKDLIGRRLFV
jgi:acyl-CoA dehydrogenase